MQRVFACLVLCDLLLLIGAAVAGLTQPGGSPDRHILLAVFSLIVTCFLQVAAFTYFTVTGKMIAQMVHLGRLDMRYIEQVKLFKGKMTRLLALLVIGLVPVAATGGALWRSGVGSFWHVVSGGLLLTLFVVVTYRQFDLIGRNADILDKVLQAYHETRRPREGATGMSRVRGGI